MLEMLEGSLSIAGCVSNQIPTSQSHMRACFMAPTGPTDRYVESRPAAVVGQVRLRVLVCSSSCLPSCKHQA